MTANVISLSQHLKSRPSELGALIECFSSRRHDQNDVYWLKENAELLNILECSGEAVNPDDLQAYAKYYNSLPDRLAFFPQYYRFLISIALDLEALGLRGNIAEQLCAFAVQQGLAEAELSDLQRAEATRLLERRDMQVFDNDQLINRLHRFIEQPARFALPNRKTAYELTHIVFYLSEYGRRDPELSPQAIQSLMFTGILAHLEQNADLLAEICVSLRFAGLTPPQAWQNYVRAVAISFDTKTSQRFEGADQYHEFLVTRWSRSQLGAQSIASGFSGERHMFFMPFERIGAMRALSQAVFERPASRRSSWGAMEQELKAEMPEATQAHLDVVVASCPEFEAFFAHFARSSTPQALSDRDVITYRKGALR